METRKVPSKWKPAMPGMPGKWQGVGRGVRRNLTAHKRFNRVTRHTEPVIAMIISHKALFLRAVAPAAMLTALVLAGCSAPKFPAGNDHDGNMSQRAIEKPTAMVTTKEMMDSTPNSKIYPPSSTNAADDAAGVSYSSPPAAYPVAPYPATITVARVASTDAAFSEQAMSISAGEIGMARVAYVRARSSEVRDFARQMLIDHRLTATQIDNFALARGYAANWTISPEDQAAIDRLESIDAAAFDRAYMDEVVRSHERAVALMQAQAASGTESAAIARNTLPGVEQHLVVARDLQRRV